jgi:DNA-binding transcriptional regulator GbsR (MarR family)
MTDAPILPDPLRPFVRDWGELGQAWGIGRSAGQVHGLLLAAGRPLAADEIAATLAVARSNVSASIRELKAIGLVEGGRGIGERKERFAPLSDPRRTALRLAAWRRAQELTPAVAALEAAGPATEAIVGLREAAALAERFLDELAALPEERLAALMQGGIAAAPGKKKKKKK